MSGVDSATSTPSLPPADTGPPAELPSGVEAPHHEHGAAAAFLEVGIHAVGEAVAGQAESVSSLFFGGMIGVTGATFGAFASTVSWIPGLIAMAYDLATARADGGREGLLDAALPAGTATPQVRAWGSGIAMVMLGATDGELASVAATLPTLDGVRAEFERGVAHAREARDSDAPGWREAREEYRDIHRAWSDGIAAAVGGWDSPERGEVFHGARERAVAFLDAHPEAAAAMRAEYQADLRDGFIDRDAGAVDEHRYRLDAGYRCGVEHRRSLEGAALEEARHDIVGMSASSFTLGHITA